MESRYSFARPLLYSAGMIAGAYTGYQAGSEMVALILSAPQNSLDSLISGHPTLTPVVCAILGSAIGVINAFGLDMIGSESRATKGVRSIWRSLIRFLNAGVPPER